MPGTTHTRIHTRARTHTCTRCLLYPLPRLQMKDWLMEHGYEKDAWELAQKRGKKADYEALLRRVTGL